MLDHSDPMAVGPVATTGGIVADDIADLVGTASIA